MCGHRGETVMEKKNGPMTYVTCLGIYVTIGGLGCCLIPFCIDDCKDKIHKCAKCNHILGKNACI